MPYKRTLEERFWAKVEQTDSCWLWRGSKTRTGYGEFWIPARQDMIRAHRVSWEFAYGVIPTDLKVLHSCDVPLCVRPDHLFLGTQADNMADMGRKGRARNRSTKLSVDDVRAIRGSYAAGALQRDLAQRFHISRPHVSRLVRRREWRFG